MAWEGCPEYPPRMSPDPRKPCVFDASCPSRQVLARVADRWAALVVFGLTRGTRRYGELRREIDGVSQRSLTQTLRGLEEVGLVVRTIYPVVPPRVEYALTPLGRSLAEPLRAVCIWADRPLPQLPRAPCRATRRPPGGPPRGAPLPGRPPRGCPGPPPRPGARGGGGGPAPPPRLASRGRPSSLARARRARGARRSRDRESSPCRRR